MLSSLARPLSLLSLLYFLGLFFEERDALSWSPSLLTKPAFSPAITKTFFIETHGCQMNLADSDIVRSVLNSINYTMCDILEEADLILINTCAIRENAESKVWQRLKYFQSLQKKNKKLGKAERSPLIGVLGCMAERLKEQVKQAGADFVAGPDEYRLLPSLLPQTLQTQGVEKKLLGEAIDGEEEVMLKGNRYLSQEETYADIRPARLHEGLTHAFVTIARGCDNHCAFCIVPYTRGRERSLPASSVIEEVDNLLSERSEEVREVVLLGQNVNSYRDITSSSTLHPNHFLVSSQGLASGFQSRSRKREGGDEGVAFGELLLRLAERHPETRFRFQSPHPKDFPDALLHLIARTPNICNSLHMPAQHGSSEMLNRMRRGYDRQAYIDLIHRARSIICGSENGLNLADPRHVGLGISSDFISGFCGETEVDHGDMLSLLRTVGFDQAFTYKYSRREQTYAGLHLSDDVPEDVKSRRLAEVVETFQLTAAVRNSLIEVGKLHVVLVEGSASSGPEQWTGRTDTNKRMVFSNSPILHRLEQDEARQFAKVLPSKVSALIHETLEKRRSKYRSVVIAGQYEAGKRETELTEVTKSSYVIVKVMSAKGHTLIGTPIATTTLQDATKLGLPFL